MDGCPRPVTAESLAKAYGADNVWSVNFAISEVADFLGESRRGALDERGRTVAHFPVPVQRRRLGAFQPTRPEPQQAQGHPYISDSAVQLIPQRSR